MEAICRPWEEPWVFGGDPLEFADGGADEFLSRKKNGLGARNYGEGGGKYANIFIR